MIQTPEVIGHRANPIFWQGERTDLRQWSLIIFEVCVHAPATRAPVFQINCFWLRSSDALFTNTFGVRIRETLSHGTARCELELLIDCGFRANKTLTLELLFIHFLGKMQAYVSLGSRSPAERSTPIYPTRQYRQIGRPNGNRLENMLTPSPSVVLYPSFY
jgi:hypothetical protein